nr:reverse transcriptase domain-containing protein [Tanacetum cinerariifolium]
MANPDPTRTTTATEPMIQEAIKNLIAQRVTEALAEYKTQRNSVVNGDISHTTGTGPRIVRPTRECTYKDYLNYETLKFNGTEGVIVSQEVAYAMPWKTLRQMMTAKYCPRGEVKKLEVELWNLKVKGTDITSYTLRFQELALLCGRRFPEESDEIERYVGGLTEMIRGNVMSYEPKSMQKAIEFANDQIDQKCNTPKLGRIGILGPGRVTS